MQKETEWIVITNQFQRLMKNARRRSCLCENVRHRECEKCVIEGHAGPMTIDMHHWLLLGCGKFWISALFQPDCQV